MTIQDLNGKKICILGFGREGKAMVAALEQTAQTCEITIADKNEKLKIENEELQHSKHRLQTGAGWLENLDTFDVIIKSPGIPPSEISQFSPEPDEGRSSQYTNSTQIFLDTVAEKGAIVVGVTGSKGKSTTSSLIQAMLKAGGKESLLLGNIGEPAIAHLDDVKKDTIIVLEMSSYQLMDLTVSPQIAVITSFFPDHLDYHASAPLGTGSSPLENYIEAKKHIARFQGEDDILVFNEQSKGAIEIAKEGEGRKVPFSDQDSPVEIEETHLIGEHNLSNIGAAATVADLLGVKQKDIIRAVKEFHGLPHRLQMVGTFGGVRWVDDAISTTPESTAAGIAALEGDVKTIILGGQDRGYDFRGLAAALIAEGIRHAILFPGSGPQIRTAIEAADTEKTIILHDAPDMQTAVKIAAQVTPEGAICLLSTASPSYGMFKNFEDKGEQFQKYVKQL